MSNRRKMTRPSRWKDKTAPQLGTVRTWMRTAEEEGGVQRAGTERTGRPGRPATLWEFTPEQAAVQASRMSGRELASKRAQAVRAGATGTWPDALQAEIRRRRAVAAGVRGGPLAAGEYPGDGSGQA